MTGATASLGLDKLAAPDVVEALDYEAILAALKTDFSQRYPAFDVADLETDPVVMVLQVAAYRELTLRQRINDAARANLLAFAQGLDLDHLGVFYGINRTHGETDTALKERIIAAIVGRSPAGSAHWYRANALSADVRVKDAAVYREDDSPVVHISVLSTDNGGQVGQELLDAVAGRCGNDLVRVVSDTIAVHAATVSDVTVKADIYLFPDTPIDVFNGLQTTFEDAFTAAAGLGWDLTQSWIYSQLHQPGVQRVVIAQPAGDVAVDFKGAVKLGGLDLAMAGRHF